MTSTQNQRLIAYLEKHGHITQLEALTELGIGTVAVFSKEDKYAMFRTKADEAYLLNPEKGPVDAYLDIDTIIRIAKRSYISSKVRFCVYILRYIL